jgi:hypothetical protein
MGDLNVFVIRPKLHAADVAKLNVQLYKFIFVGESSPVPTEESQEKQNQNSG